MASKTFKISDKATQARLACKRLVQYIHQQKLGHGDILPAQEKLRRELGFSHDSLSRAMALLVEYGVVSRQPGVKTVIENRAAAIPDLWTVGIPVFSIDQFTDLFINTKLYYLQAELNKVGCRWKCYMRQGIPEDSHARIADFLDLTSDIEQGNIDGILAPALLDQMDVCQLQSSGFPVCQVMALENFNCGIGINTASMIKKAVTELLAEGCQYLALISGPTIMDERQEKARQAFQTTLEELAGPHTKAELFATQTPVVSRQAGQQIARLLLQRPQAQRPDGMIVLSDVLAVGISEVCARHHYRPQLMIQTSQQIPLSFSLPATCFEVDVSQMAQMGVQMILERLHSPLLANEKKWTVPQLIQEELDWDENQFQISQMPVAVRACA